MTLDEMLEGAARGATTVAPGWGQGRATFGGLVAGLLVSRGEALVADHGRRLRSASFSFAGPVAPGEARLEGRVLRSGGSATYVQVQLEQEGEARAVMLAAFGGDRDSRIRVDADPRNPRPALPPPEAVERLPYVPGTTPDFFTHVDLRWATGALPFSGSPEPDFGGWMRLAAVPATFGDRELLVLADAWPPAILPMLGRPTSMSTIAWTFEPLALPAAAPRDDGGAFWQYDVRTLAAGGGYAQTSARIWDGAGRLRAVSGQTVAYFG